MPATRSLKTDWKRIGRSGPTVDGREISPQMLLDCAETYDKETFTALIWPEHFHWINYGLVEEVKAEKNKDGGVDLFAILSPNKMYLDTNSMGQRLFLSMELMANFAKTGKTYLTGLAATDDPASLATSEMRFSAESKKAGLIQGQHEEISFAAGPMAKEDEAEALSLFRRFVAKLTNSQLPNEDDDMADKAALDAMQKRIDTLEAQAKKFTKPALSRSNGAGPGDDDGDGDGDDDGDAAITKLAKQVEELAAKVEKFTTPPSDPGKEAAKATDEILTKLTKQVTDLETKLTAALKEQPGTNAGEHSGSEGEADKFANIY